MDSSVPSTPTLTFNVLTYNCWGLKYLATHRIPRLLQIGTEISTLNPPPAIVALQECWTQQDYNAIREQTKHILPYGKFYWSGIFGGGLAILSRWPIVESRMHRYTLNGRPTAFFRGDWYVGKGVACAKIRLPGTEGAGEGKGRGRVVEVFCTHLHAPYEREPNDSYICHRTAQAWEISNLMRSSYSAGHIVLAMGDFNMIPLSLAHQIVERHGRASDVWRIKHPDSSIGAAVDDIERTRGRLIPSVGFNLTENGATCDSRLNTWRWTEEERKRLGKGEKIMVDDREEDPRAKRLDYIFLGDALGGSAVRDVEVGMTMRHPTLKCSLSDHFSVEATLEVNTDGPSGDETSNFYSTFLSGSLDTPLYLPTTTYTTILTMIEKYTLRERRQRRLRLSHFGGWVVTAIGCFVTIWWSPKNYVSFLLMLLSTLGLSAGVIDGLIGGLFMSGEIRALKEFEWEVRNARDAAIEVGGGGGQVGEGVMSGGRDEAVELYK
ncbi:sphingomyelinase family protein [Tothia fuscella]|uniref:Sphingomyelinase family protein n=1 Tax=Tothia fuscella TaxID=1048955 RepID=A0A9P4P4D5_9PEZI|nr:sphingomyelinase family protein [Tothia fuscella]